ncbi:MAG TPA: hypothetical protein ENJ95_19950 [Bacteroidetes bacterium]|nr:hypothetical protein [Bacteroidota bacterium]
MDIICIDDNFSPEQTAAIPNRPVKDKMYTVRDVVKSANGIGLLLNEIQNPHSGWVMRNGMKFTFEPNFNIRRFSDLQHRPLNHEELQMVKKGV